MTTGNGSSDDFKRAMVVTAHPDDAEYGCSATVAKWCRLGWDVVYVLCTDGSKGSDDREMNSEQLAELRESEQREAGRTLGLKDVVFLGYPDGYLEPTLEVRKDITREIRRWRPDVLITMSPTRDLMGSTYIGHPDHFAAGEAALAAVFRERAAIDQRWRQHAAARPDLGQRARSVPERAWRGLSRGLRFRRPRQFGVHHFDRSIRPPP